MRWGRTQDTNANIHHQAGYWVLLPLVVLALTGATISFPSVLPALAGETAATSAEFIRSQAAPLPRPRSNLAAVLASIAVRYPHARLISATWPTVLDPHWNLTFDDRQGVVSAAVEDGTGTVTSGRSGPPETAARLMRRIHDGTGMPVIWQVVIFASGLFGATLAVTGALMWVRGRARGRRMRGRRSGRTAT